MVTRTHEWRHTHTHDGDTHAYGGGTHQRTKATSTHNGGTHAHEGDSTRTDSGTHAHGALEGTAARSTNMMTARTAARDAHDVNKFFTEFGVMVCFGLCARSPARPGS